MAASDGGHTNGEGGGWMGRAFGKVIGIFSTNQNGSKLEDENGADLDLEVPARGQDKKRRRGEYVKEQKYCCKVH